MRRALAVAAAAATLLLSGCEASVSTEIVVTGAAGAQVSVESRFTGQAAGTLGQDDAALAQLLGVFADRTGRQPELESGPDELIVRTHLSYDQLTSAGKLVGVERAALSGTDDRATVSVKLVPVTELADAVHAATSEQPDADALAATMLRSTRVVVAITFPGGVESADGAAAVTDGNTVTVTRTADDTTSATLTVVGDPTPSRWPYLGAAAAVIAGGVLAWRLRRR